MDCLMQNRFAQIVISALLILTFLPDASVRAAQDYPRLKVSHTGQLQMSALQSPGNSYSPDGSYRSSWRIGHVGHDQRQLLDFELLHNGNILYHLDQAPGSDLYLADNGICVFIQHLHGPSANLRLSFLDRDGHLLLEYLPAAAPTLFEFSPTGDRFAVGNSNSLELIELPTGDVTILPGGWELAVAEDENLTAIAGANRLQLFREASLTADLITGIPLPRRIVFSPDNETVALAGRTRLEIYNTQTAALTGTAVLRDGRTYRDLHCIEGGVLAGVQLRGENSSSGFLQLYNGQGQLLEEYPGETRPHPHAGETVEARNVSRQRDTIPWPFFPFDSMRTVWNHYEQHMGGYGVDYSYLHQGLDLITPIAEPVYAVESGVVKCVLTLGGAVYWRIAVSPVQEPGWSTGWLYAHLIESSIQFDTGDTVLIHDYLGDIIQWSDDWGHIHFAEIEDSGIVWQYDDNEWGITRDPMPLLDPLPDTTAPVFEDVFPGSRFAFCRNNDTLYLDPGDLNGALDIVVKVYDLAGPSPWQQPAHSLYYWIERMADGQLVVPRTLSQVLDHPYPFYSSSNYEPWATLFYQRDQLLQPSSWMDTTRNYHQVLTNSNGDSLALLSEKELALETTGFQNGLYRIFAEAQDDNGNFTRDSMEVSFNNPGNDWMPEITGLWINDGTLYIDWDEIPAASGYTMYSSSHPYSGFTIDTSGNYSGSSWQTEVEIGSVRYYRVTAEIP